MLQVSLQTENGSFVLETLGEVAAFALSDFLGKREATF